MHDQDIDNLFQSGLKNQHFEITDAYMDDLLNRLEEKKKRHGFFWFFGGIGVFTLLVLTSIALFSSTAQFPIKRSAGFDSILKNSLAHSDKFHLEGRGREKAFNHADNKKVYSTGVEPIVNVSTQKTNGNNQLKAVKSTYTSYPNQPMETKTYYIKLPVLIHRSNEHPTLLTGSEEIKKVEQNQLVNKEPILPYQEENKNINFLFSAEMGLNYSSTKYAGPESNYYQTNHINTPTNNYEFNTEMLIRNKLSFGIGIGAYEQEYEYDYNVSTTAYDTTHTLDSSYVFEYYIFDGGVIVDSVYHYDHFTTTTIDSTDVNHNWNGITRAKYLSIPFHISYYFTHKRFMFGIRATARINILQNANGGFYSGNSFETFNFSDNPLFKKSYLAFSFSAQMNYNIYKNFFLKGSIGYSPYFNPDIHTQDLERKTQLIRMSFGVAYRL